MEPRLSDPDLTLYTGDALEVLRELPAESVDCCVTSPPYFGLRDYGIEGQVGLEATPADYVAKMVEIFREVRRVLAPHGTVWLNLGDTYAADRSYQVPDSKHTDVGNTMKARVPEGLKAKDLIGIPWRVAFALQDDGWWLRSDIIWHKPNAMPSPVRDRPTTSHEYVFLLSKNARYYFDREAVLEPAAWERWGKQTVPKYEGTDTATGWIKPQSKEELSNNGVTADGKNIRDVWSIPTQPYPEAHFATFPEELPRRAILAGCPEWVCRTCGKARERITKRVDQGWDGSQYGERVVDVNVGSGGTAKSTLGSSGGRLTGKSESLGFTDCGHGDYREGVVLDPFAGAGTTALVARSLCRHSLLIELSDEYCGLITTRLQQLSLLTT